MSRILNFKLKTRAAYNSGSDLPLAPKFSITLLDFGFLNTINDLYTFNL